MIGQRIDGTVTSDDGSHIGLGRTGVVCDEGIRAGVYVSTVWLDGIWTTGVWSGAVWDGAVW